MSDKMFLISEELRDKVVDRAFVEDFMFVKDALRTITPAEPVAGVTRIQLGHGLVVVSDGHVMGVPAIIFSKGGNGVVGSKEYPGERFLENGEEIASITFENVASLNVVREELDEVAQKSFGQLPSLQPATLRAITPAEPVADFHYETFINGVEAFDWCDSDILRDIKSAMGTAKWVNEKPAEQVAGVTREAAIAEFRMDELDAVMYFVDKWFNKGDPRLKDNPAQRASTAREIALKAIEAAPQPATLRSWDKVGKDAKEQFDELDKGWDWRSFYNGYLLGAESERKSQGSLAGLIGGSEAVVQSPASDAVLADGNDAVGGHLQGLPVADQVRLYLKSGGSVQGAERLAEKLTAPQPVDLSGVKYVPGAMCKKHLVYYKTMDGGQNKTVQYCPVCDDEKNPFLAHLTAQATPQVVGSCGWSQDEWSESWSAGCGCEWVFPDGGPAENGMKFCPSCGKPVSLPAPPTKGAE